MIRLIVNADGFGATEEGDRNILTAHRQGIVTSTAVLGNCADITAVHAALQAAPDLGVGLSLTLIGGRPIARPADVPSLVPVAGQLRARPANFAIDWFKQAILPEHVEIEMEAQITRARAAGLTIDHLCTHCHVGFLPGVGQIVERLARRHRIAGLRTTVEPPTLTWITDPRRGIETGVLAGLSWLTRRRLGALRHGPRSWGYIDSGHLDEVRILEIIGRLAPGAHELICNPGGGVQDGDTVTELRALTSTKVKTALQRRGVVLSRWRDLF